MEWPVMFQVVVIPYLSDKSSRRGVPTLAACTPREMSQDESSPPKDPSHTDTEPKCTLKHTWISLSAMVAAPDFALVCRAKTRAARRSTLTIRCCSMQGAAAVSARCARLPGPRGIHHGQKGFDRCLSVRH